MFLYSSDFAASLASTWPTLRLSLSNVHREPFPVIQETAKPDAKNPFPVIASLTRIVKGNEHEILHRHVRIGDDAVEYDVDRFFHLR